MRRALNSADASSHIPTFNRQSIATSKQFAVWRWGVTGFDKEIGIYVRGAKLRYLFKLPQIFKCDQNRIGSSFAHSGEGSSVRLRISLSDRSPVSETR